MARRRSDREQWESLREARARAIEAKKEAEAQAARVEEARKGTEEDHHEKVDQLKVSCCFCLVVGIAEELFGLFKKSVKVQ